MGRMAGLWPGMAGYGGYGRVWKSGKFKINYLCTTFSSTLRFVLLFVRFVLLRPKSLCATLGVTSHSKD